MPFIRDFATAYEASTADAGLTIPICNYQQNDLLLVFAMADTGTPTWGCSGYTQLYARNNTVATICYYKIAGASESDIVITSTVGETYNGCVIAIGDVDTSYPFGNAAVYSETTQASSTRFAMSTITTTRNDALVIYQATSSATASGIHFVENSAHEILVSDGTAEGMGVGWSFQKATGTTPSNIYACVPTAGIGTKATIQIWPPSGGATVIPPHCVSDASIYLEPNSAAANFDSNVYMAATADTNFGTSIASKTCNDATVAASADIGINSFHSFMGLTNATTSGQISGANLGLSAARYAVGNRNILAHFRHTTPAHNQRLSPIGSGRGIWMGLQSGTTATQNWKVWQVHGADSIMVAGYIQPLIINPTNTDTIATNGTLNSADVRYVGFWNGGLGVLTNQACIGPMWAMDTLVMAGGTSTLPIGITEIVDVAARAKERLSTIQQGSKQMLCLQTIQIGNGGTNPTYLNLDSTAIEFPTRRNVPEKVVNYNGVDNSVGIIYYPGASDTINHKNSVISSANRFAWGLHASASTSATYNFSGTSVIGAGTITLNRAITITGLTINNYSTINASGLTLNSSAITVVPATNDSITVDASSTFNTCSFNVTTVTAGNRLLSTTTPNKFTSCTFTGSASAGHAIRISSATGSPFTLTGNTFTAFGGTPGSNLVANSGSTSAAIFNDSGSAIVINLNTSGGGNTPSVRNGVGATTTINNNVTITITVKDEAGANVQSATVAIYKTSDMTQIMNTTTNSSGVATTTFNYVSDTAVTIRVRKSSATPKYISTETSGTIASTGLTTTVTFVAEDIAEATTDANIAGDFTINTTTKTIRHVTGETPIYSVKKLYTWLMDYFDESGTIVNTIPMTAQTPTEFTLVNGWFIDDTSIQFLNGGAIQTSGWTHPTNITGIRVLTLASISGVDSSDLGTAVAGATTGDTGKLLHYNTTLKKLWIRADAADDLFDNTSENINVNSSLAGAMGGAVSVTGETIYSNIFTLGTLVSGTTMDVYQNDAQITPWWTAGHIDVLIKVKEASVEVDSGNLTVLARKYSTLYDHYVIDASSGRNPVPLAAFADVNNETIEGTVGAAPYTNIAITFGSNLHDVNGDSTNEPYDVSINCATLTLTQAYEYLKYITRTGSSSTLNGVNGEYYQAVGDIRFTYTTGAGTFAEGNTITDSTSGATGYITSRIATSNTLVVRNTHGTFTNGDSINNGAGATGTINSVPSAIAQSKQAPFGTFAGGQFFGARGVYIYNMAGADANNYQLIDSTGTTRTPPVTVNTTITIKDLSTDAVIQGANVLAWVTDNSNYFYQASVSITGSGTTATVSHTAHGMITGDYVIIEGVTNDDDYNGVYQITKTNDNQYTYTTTETLGSTPATGTIKATFALISDTTDSNGQVSDTRALSNNQPITGWVRKSSADPYYQQGAISGTVSNSNGLSVTIQLARDQ